MRAQVNVQCSSLPVRSPRVCWSTPSRPQRPAPHPRRIALQFVRAADAIGQPFCITLAALDPVRKQVLHTKQAHTGMGLNLTLLADTTQAQQDDASSTTSASSGTNVGAIVGGVAGGLVLACAALAGALMYRRTRRQAEAASGAKPVGAAAEHAGGGGGGSSRLLGSEPEEDLATVPTKPHGSGPMALPSWLAQTSSGSQPVTPPAHDFFLSYVTSVGAVELALPPQPLPCTLGKAFRMCGLPCTWHTTEQRGLTLQMPPPMPRSLPNRMRRLPSRAAAAAAAARPAVAVDPTNCCSRGRLLSTS